MTAEYVLTAPLDLSRRVLHLHGVVWFAGRMLVKPFRSLLQVSWRASVLLACEAMQRGLWKLVSRKRARKTSRRSRRLVVGESSPHCASSRTDIVARAADLGAQRRLLTAPLRVRASVPRGALERTIVTHYGRSLRRFEPGNQQPTSAAMEHERSSSTAGPAAGRTRRAQLAWWQHGMGMVASWRSRRLCGARRRRRQGKQEHAAAGCRARSAARRRDAAARRGGRCEPQAARRAAARSLSAQPPLCGTEAPHAREGGSVSVCFGRARWSPRSSWTITPGAS